MKKLILSSTLSIISLISAPKVFAGPGESSGNTNNDCNTSSSTCNITPSKFSAKIYRVALCTSNPMADNMPLDWVSAGCEDVYNSANGEETGNIFSETGATLSASNVSIPKEGEYSYIAALFDKSFKAGSHHMVYKAGVIPETPVNNKRYYSEENGNAQEGSAADVQLMDGSFNTFMPQMDCSGGWSSTAPHVQRTDATMTQAGFGGFLDAGETFFGRVLDSNYEIASINGGDMSTSTAFCADGMYLLSIVDKAITINETTSGIHIKILAPKGLVRADQGNGNGQVLTFSTHGESVAVKVIPLSE